MQYMDAHLWYCFLWPGPGSRQEESVGRDNVGQGKVSLLLIMLTVGERWRWLTWLWEDTGRWWLGGPGKQVVSSTSTSQWAVLVWLRVVQCSAAHHLARLTSLSTINVRLEWCSNSLQSDQYLVGQNIITNILSPTLSSQRPSEWWCLHSEGPCPQHWVVSSLYILQVFRKHFVVHRSLWM